MSYYFGIMKLTDLALFAAVFAAIITCIFNVLLASRQQRAQNAHWLLGKKQEAYVRFLHARRDMINLAVYEKNPTKLADGRRKLLTNLRPTEISLLAPESIAHAADNIYKKTKDLIDPKNPMVWNPARNPEIDVIHDLTDKFRDLVREDLDKVLKASKKWRLAGPRH